ncbi:hypothetical protein R3P38DRAFT_2787428 [Favolaschia claudopus]|uniref:Uncharacterized protein n=1 Tax=Favolaschia claudopus TaxID=2862362 RepID=A0AAW0AMY0_9AGAR
MDAELGMMRSQCRRGAVWAGSRCRCVGKQAEVEAEDGELDCDLEEEEDVEQDANSNAEYEVYFVVTGNLDSNGHARGGGNVGIYWREEKMVDWDYMKLEDGQRHRRDCASWEAEIRQNEPDAPPSLKMRPICETGTGDLELDELDDWVARSPLATFRGGTVDPLSGILAHERYTGRDGGGTRLRFHDHPLSTTAVTTDRK